MMTNMEYILFGFLLFICLFLLALLVGFISSPNYPTEEQKENRKEASKRLIQHIIGKRKSLL